MLSADLPFSPLAGLLRIGLAAALWAAPPAAQLDVPDDPPPPADAQGVEIPRKATGDLAPKRGPTAQERRGGLDLGPGSPRGAPRGPAPRPEADPDVGPPPRVEIPPAAAGQLSSSAAVALDELALVQDPRDPRLGVLVARLRGEGPEGLAAARVALRGAQVGQVLGAARVLLDGGLLEDHERVVARLSGPLPVRAIAPLFDLVAAADPVRDAPELWIGLLEHEQASAREAAARRFAGRVRAADVPAIAVRLRSKRADTRRLAVELLAGVSDPTATNLLLDRLGDASPKVAAQAARILAARDSAEDAILAAAFPEGFVDRRAAYARLAVAEREDRVPTSLVGDERVAVLLPELGHDDPLRRGAAAILLAGIGFRAEGSRGYAWLDREVPHELVRIVSADGFHRDFGSLADPARRRLVLLSGQTIDADGGAWRAWWIDAFQGFRARRAVIEVGPAEETTLVVRYRGGAPGDLAVRFVGPDAPPDPEGTVMLARTVLLTAPEAADLARRLAEEGLFSARRLPSPAAAFTTSTRELDVEVGEQSKRIVLPAVPAPGADPWLDRLAHTLLAIDEDHRWQRYPAGQEARAFEGSEGPWWHEPRDERERDRRLKDLVLADLASRPAFERAPALSELERLAERGAVGPADYPDLLDLLLAERYHGERVTRLVALARRSVRDADGRLPDEAAWRLIEVLAASFPDEAGEDVAAVLAESDPALTRRAARDDRAVLRALAAIGIARGDGEEDTELLAALLRDPVDDVEAACLLALAEGGRRDLADEILFRARMGEPRVREAALRAAGRLRLEGASSALAAGLTDASQAIQIAAVEGLADLRDPDAAPMLVSLLARGTRSPLYPGAERGLRALGPAARDVLARAAQSPGSEARRSAALLLAEDLAPQAIRPLLELLAENPSDGRVASELAILSAVDYRQLDKPHAAWTVWWQGVRPDDSLAWFRAGCERVGLRAPEAATLVGEGTPEGRRFLLDVLARSENHLVERARRELGRMLGGDLGPMPARGALRDEWLAELRARAAAR